MNRKQTRFLTVLFVLGGMLAGYLSYRLAGCTSGTCLITATPLRAMLYMGFVGWLLSGALTGGCAACQVKVCHEQPEPTRESTRR